MDFPLYSKTWQANEKREERENNKSTTNLGFQLFILLRKGQKAETILLFSSLGAVVLKDIFYAFS